MFNKKKKLQKSFNDINKRIDSLTLSDQEKRNLKGLLLNVKIRTGVA
ncbi:hypothetical protein Javan150_0009 [Streptococcus phage Javan150]|nr:hypothetical protein [Streptococcus dysgalactiae]QBX23750.1 hypothetical protein Javan150_0009 [Streptococcus phage Javan150]HEQ8383865.1 hypothetical protein [Streptococcus pyogenes]WEQ88379.1 hypothetical protein MGCS35823_01706 [Streptococcus dysgalactiae subsp. equisimilis]SQG93528.1 phage protein [Streptococcus dysgalactiae subsp. equisimilis]HER2662557.1 hypothetical protein [Streptococcus pyogenes]